MTNIPTRFKLATSLLLGLALLVVLHSSIAPVLAAQGIIGSINVGSFPHVATVNPTTNRVYVANANGGDISVIDGSTKSVLTTIPVGTNPGGMAVNATTNRLYVAMGGNDSVSVVDTLSNSVVATTTVGSGPGFLAVNATTNRIYVPNLYSGNVSVIDGATNSVIATTTVGSGPVSAGVHTSNNTIYVANRSGGTVSVIDSTTNSVVTNITVGTNPNGIAVNEATNRVYVSNINSNNVSVINSLTNSVVATVTLAAGPGPGGLVVNPTTNRVYVNSQQGNTVTVIDGVTNTIEQTIGGVGFPSTLGINPTTNRVYVPEPFNNKVVIIGDFSAPPSLTKAFSPATIATGQLTTLTFTLSNPNATTLTNISFTDALPTQLKVAPAPAIANACGSGNVEANGGSGSITVSGVTLVGNQSCTIKVNITSTTLGTWTNTVSTISATESLPATINASANLTVTPLLVYISDASVTEGNSGTTNAAFNVSLAVSSTATVMMNYATSDGTATVADNDYVAKSGTLSFAPGVISQNISVVIKGDTKIEGTETFSVTLSNPVNATFNNNKATGYIVTDECDPYKVTEQGDSGNGACGTLSFALNAAAQADHSVTIDLTIPTIYLQGPLPVVTPTFAVTIAGSCNTVNERGVPGTLITTGAFNTDSISSMALAQPAVGITLTNKMTLSGVKIGGFSNTGVVITGNDNAIKCSWLGTSDGTTNQYSNGIGIRIAGSNNTLGEVGNAASGNLISGNTGVGVQLESGALNNSLYYNWVGVQNDGVGLLLNSGGALRVPAGAQLKVGLGNKFRS